MSDRQLAIIIDTITQDYRIKLDTGIPRVADKETITARGKANFIHRKQVGGTMQYAEVEMTFEPFPQGRGVVFRKQNKKWMCS
ncbi:MAG: hypothetical protein VKO39_13780 [Cyanobacteriota bacterium]|nr:hypothetical protein [Cyanobacteriota bacterium]